MIPFLGIVGMFRNQFIIFNYLKLFQIQHYKGRRGSSLSKPRLLLDHRLLNVSQTKIHIFGYIFKFSKIISILSKTVMPSSSASFDSAPSNIQDDIVCLMYMKGFKKGDSNAENVIKGWQGAVRLDDYKYVHFRNVKFLYFMSKKGRL